MSGTLRFLMVAALIILIIGVYFTLEVLADSGGIFTVVPTALSEGTAPKPVGFQPDLLEVRLHYCAGSTTYTLLSMPRDANFSMALATDSLSQAPAIPVTGATPQPSSTIRPATSSLGINACTEVGLVESRKLVLCRGQAPTRFDITVSNAAGFQAYSLTLARCTALNRSAP